MGATALKCTPNAGNYSASYNRNNLPGALYFLKSFKRIFVATNHQTNDLPKTGTPEKEGRNGLLKNHGPEVVAFIIEIKKHHDPRIPHRGSTKAAKTTEQ